MKLTYILIAISTIGLFGCGNNKSTSSTENTSQSEELSVINLDNKQQTFILELSSIYPAPFLVSNTFRNRYITKNDLRGLKEFSKKYPEVIFDTTTLTDKSIELLADTNQLHANLYWVNDKDVHTCKSVVRDLWPCFKNRYQHQAFYYFSAPIYSTDGKHVLVSLNFVSVNNNESYGGLRVFKNEKNKWEEFAVLGNWGKSQ